MQVRNQMTFKICIALLKQMTLKKILNKLRSNKQSVSLKHSLQTHLHLS